MIEFDRNPNALRDEILVDHSWALGEDGALAVPMDRWALIMVVLLWLNMAIKNDVILARCNEQIRNCALAMPIERSLIVVLLPVMMILSNISKAFGKRGKEL